MLKIKVIADNILNLTDARYFAAFGVDYLVFNLSNISPEQAKEIGDWVEGVSLLLEFSEALRPQDLDFILKLNPAGFISSKNSVLQELKSQFPELEILLREDHQISSIISDGSSKQKIFVKPDLDKLNLEQIISDQNIDGIIVEGEAEEKVGFKNFDELDELFDQLMIEV